MRGEEREELRRRRSRGKMRGVHLEVVHLYLRAGGREEHAGAPLLFHLVEVEVQVDMEVEVEVKVEVEVEVDKRVEVEVEVEVDVGVEVEMYVYRTSRLSWPVGWVIMAWFATWNTTELLDTCRREVGGVRGGGVECCAAPPAWGGVRGWLLLPSPLPLRSPA